MTLHGGLLHVDQELDPEQLVRAVAMARTFWEHLHPENAHVTHIEQQFSFSFPVDGVAHTIRGSIDRSQHSAFRSLPNLDWPRTIRRNLKHYNSTLKTIIPDEISFFRRRHRQNEWNVIIAMDQSGSMATSLIYGGIMGAILASMPAVARMSGPLRAVTGRPSTRSCAPVSRWV